MSRKLSRVLPFCLGILSLLFLPVWAGCGSSGADATSGTANNGSNSGTQSGAAVARTDFQWADIFKNLEGTVEVTATDGVHFIYSQKKGSWRWESPANGMMAVYNKEANKTWAVIGGEVTESASDGGGPSFSPLMFFSPLQYSVPTSRSDNTLIYEIPGNGKDTIELAGPNNLPSKLTIDLPPEKTKVIEFKYSNMNSVPDSLFQRPAGASTSGSGSGSNGTGNSYY